MEIKKQNLFYDSVTDNGAEQFVILIFSYQEITDHCFCYFFCSSFHFSSEVWCDSSLSTGVLCIMNELGLRMKQFNLLHPIAHVQLQYLFFFLAFFIIFRICLCFIIIYINHSNAAMLEFQKIEALMGY